jgi:hypothetical protein
MRALYLAMPRHAAAVLAYAALTLAYTWPMVLQLGSVAPNDLGDPLLSTWTLWWNASVLPLTERWWNGPIFFPAPDTLTLSDHRLGIGLISTPAIWLGWSPAAAHNLAFLASFVLGAVGAYALGFALTGNHGAAFLAGLVFGFNPFRAGHLPHLELLCSYWLPVALLALHRWGETRKPVWLVALSAALTMQAVTSVYYFAFFGVVVGLWLVWFVRLRLPLKDYAALGASLAAPLVIIAPILLRYRRAHASMGLSRTLVEIESFSADLVGLLTTPQTLALWNSPLSWDKGEGALYPGAVAVALVVAGLLAMAPPPVPAWQIWKRRLRQALLVGGAFAAIAAAVPAVWGPVTADVLGVSLSISQSFKPVSVAVLLVGGWLLTTDRIRREWHARSTLAFFALTTVAMWVFALGPTGRVLGERFLYKAPYSWLMLLPGVDTAFRVPARFGMLAALTLSAATALAWVGLTRGRSRRWTAVAASVAALAIVADSWIKPMQLPSLPSPLEIPADAPPDAVVLELPLGVLEDAAAMYRSIAYGRPTINGLSGYDPPHYQVLRAALDEGRYDVLTVLAASAPIAVVVDTAAAGPMLSTALQALDTAQLIAHAETHDVILLKQSTGSAAAPPHERSTITPVAIDSRPAATDVSVMTDGDRITLWMTDEQHGTEEITLDMGAVHALNGVSFDQGGLPAAFPRTLSVSLSHEGADWEEVWRGDTAPLVMAAAIRTPRDVTVEIPFEQRRARFVRLRQVGRSDEGWAVAEVRALAATP